MARDYASLQRKPFLTPIWLSILSAVIGFGCLCFAAWAAWLWVTADSTTIIVVRSAESGMGDEDRSLTPAGEARAERLGELFGNDRAPGRVDAIYISPSRRSRMTAAPLASRLGLTPIESAVAGPETRSWMRHIVRDHSGGRILIIGERDSVPEIVRQSGNVGEVPAMSDNDYGTLYIIAAPSIGRANLTRLTY